MIEVSWQKEENGIIPITRLMAWLLSTLTLTTKEQKEQMKGFMVLQDCDTTRCLVICDGELNEKIMQALKDPPAEYVGKYVASLMSEEPSPIQETQAPIEETPPVIESE